MVESEKFDLVVIGSGPAGEKGAAQAAYHGKRVAIVERSNRPGGATVTNAGIPTKALRETALYVSGLHKKEIYGVTLALDRAEAFAHLRARTAAVSEAVSQTVRHNLDRHRIELITGTARLGPDATVHVATPDGATRVLAGDVLLVATGSRPLRPSSLPFDDPGVVDSEGIIELAEPFDRITVLGAGAVGCEYASIFAALGIDVSLIDQAERLVPFMDAELSGLLAESFARLGIDVRLRTSVVGIARHEGGLTVQLADGESLDTDRVLVSVGRVPTTAGLGLEQAGVQLNERGRAVVDENFQTTAKGIYAAGDVVGSGLAAIAMEQARVAICHAFGIPFKLAVDPAPPAAVYSIPEVASVGLTEQDAVGAGLDCEVGRGWLTTNQRAQIAGDTEGLIKLVFARHDQRLLGVHIIGEDAGELVHQGQAVLRHGGDIRYFIDTTFNLPTRSDAYKYAAYDGLARVGR